MLKLDILINKRKNMAFNERQSQNDDRLLDLRIQLDTKLKKYLETKNDSNEENKPLWDFLREINTLSVNDKKIYQNYVWNLIRRVDTSFIQDISDDLKQFKKLDMLNAWRGIENSIKENYSNQEDNYGDNRNNDIQNNDNNLVFAGWSIQETVHVIKNFKFDTKNENRISPIDWEVRSLWNNRYEISLYRIDWWEIWKINVLYNTYWNKVQIFDEYRNRLIWEQYINTGGRGNWWRHYNWGRDNYRSPHNNLQYPSTEFNIKLDNWSLVNINLAFPNR